LEHRGLEAVYEQIESFIQLKKSSGRFEEVRKQQAEKRFDYWVKELILQKQSQEIGEPILQSTQK
jgi:LAO/AO transport system kinase